MLKQPDMAAEVPDDEKVDTGVFDVTQQETGSEFRERTAIGREIERLNKAREAFEAVAGPIGRPGDVKNLDNLRIVFEQAFEGGFSYKDLGMPRDQYDLWVAIFSNEGASVGLNDIFLKLNEKINKHLPGYNELKDFMQSHPYVG